MSETRESEFAGEVAIVTGASSGIGRATAIRLAAGGARVAIFARSASKLEELAAAHPGAMIAVPGNAADESSLGRLVETTTSRLGNCTILVNNAGHIEPKTVEEMSTAEWDLHFAVNVRAAFILSRLVLPGMRASGRGAIVNVASISGVPGPQKFPGFAAYCAAKAAVIGFSEALAVEVKDAGIRVNAVSPGSVDTPMLRRVAPSLETDVTPEQLAELVAFLASERSMAINGQNLRGWSA
jgi:NAD(P)-dependent dehydrogenase (short-subunit alcohol dehydrogenase family)